MITLVILKCLFVVPVLGITVCLELLHHIGVPAFWGVLLLGLVAATVNLSPDRRVGGQESLKAAVRAPHIAPQVKETADPRPRALIVGSGTVARALARNLETDGYHVVGFVDDGPNVAESADPQIMGGLAATSCIVAEHGIDSVFLAQAPSWQQHLAETLVAEHPAINVSIVPSYQETMMRINRVESSGDIALIRLTGTAQEYADAAKRIFDLMAAVVGLIVTAPLLMLVALLIKLTSPGPVLFKQERVGRFGEPFLLVKFRTMVPDAEAGTGPVLAKGKQDARLTALGRWLRLFRIDELPQFWNVLRGEMSMVGPRPERPFFVEQFKRRLPAYAKRHTVRPGITGLAQVYGGYHTDWQDKLRFDLLYISQQSLWTDLKILLRTVLVVCKPHR